MKRFFLYLTFLAVTSSSSSFAMDSKEEGVIISSPSSTVKVKDLEAQVDLEEDVPGCVDNYFRFSVGFWQIAGGWFDLGTTLTSSTATFLSGLATMGNLSESQRTNLGIAAVVCGSTATCLHVLKNYSLRAIQERRNSLIEVIKDHHKK